MTLKERYFETGYVVEMRDGDKYIVLRQGKKVHLSFLQVENVNKVYRMRGWMAMESYDDDLCYKSESEAAREFDIVKVYDYIEELNDKTRVVWEREENYTIYHFN